MHVDIYPPILINTSSILAQNDAFFYQSIDESGRSGNNVSATEFQIQSFDNATLDGGLLLLGGLAVLGLRAKNKRQKKN